MWHGNIRHGAMQGPAVAPERVPEPASLPPPRHKQQPRFKFSAAPRTQLVFHRGEVGSPQMAFHPVSTPPV